MWPHSGIGWAPGLVDWSLRDTARAIRAEEELEKGVPIHPDLDRRFYDLVLAATNDAEFARLQLKERVRTRSMEAARGS